MAVNRALVVEDNDRFRELIVFVLKSIGATDIVEARDGREAIDSLRTFNADIVVMDWKMEVMDGLEWTRQIRAGVHAIDPQTPVILLTGQVSRESEAAGYAAGVNLFMGKPISLRKLQRGLTQVLNERNGAKMLVH